MLVACPGSAIVTGIGKAGWIGQKISATLASLGTRSHFLHPSEAMHGDLGRIADDDLVLALSNSGESAELLQILPMLRKRRIHVVALTATDANSLSRAATLTLAYGDHGEACYLGLAPTTSTTVMLALGDALALAVAHRRAFQPIDFARYHPGGSLGRALSKVEEIMRPIDTCRVARDDASVRTVFIQSQRSGRRSGAILLVDARGQLTGLFTDSDLARLLEQQQEARFDAPIASVMTRQPITIAAGQLTRVAVETLATHNISELPVVDSAGRPVGLIDVTDVVGLLPRSS
jgi:arabinose-5-phosphate isomerase